jgi:hypothetical protein
VFKLLTSTSVRAVDTESQRVVLRSGSLYFGAWPPSLRERPWRGVHLHGSRRVRSRGSKLPATVYLAMLNTCGTHGTAGCRVTLSQIFVTAFAERFRIERQIPILSFRLLVHRNGRRS